MHTSSTCPVANSTDRPVSDLTTWPTLGLVPLPYTPDTRPGEVGADRKPVYFHHHILYQNPGMQSRLVDLETRYTHLARQVDELGQVVFEQQKTIDRLTMELALLHRRVSGVDGAPGERPPHY